ncbi:alpha/beta fold hydrolase [Natronosalvus vescus]|uniref:alpha/beta fold hydrolase n=1 Tax=Natronosalvus vescus TaxID=2953881 RepID=UPI0020910B11|nr:alpha/beta hydrolase [Natronosalvus vescus]
MIRVAESPTPTTHAPADWPTDAERVYATQQARLADHYNLEVESRSLETKVAGRVHYLEAGDPDGEPVVLLHGVSMTAATWLPMVSALTDEYRVYIPDRPGRGLSDAPSYRGRDLRRFMVAYLLELFDGLALDQPHVVGSSLGGQQAFLLAIDHDHVDRLCLVGAPGGISREFPVLQRLLTVRGVNRLLFWLEGRGDPVENAMDAAEQVLVDDTSAIPDEFYEVIAASKELPGRQESLRSLTTEQGSFGRMHPLFDLRDEIIDIERPTAFVWGTEDAYWPPEVGRPVADRMVNATFEVLEGHGHVPWMEPGDETETRIRSFLDG